MANKKIPGSGYSFGDDSLYDRFFIQLQHLPSQNDIFFKAFLTQFEDQFTSDWATEQLFGRMDPVRSFRGTQRVITLGFDVVAASLEESKHNLHMCSEFLSMLYPSYGGASALSGQQDTATSAENGTNDAQKESSRNRITAAGDSADAVTPQNAATIQGAPLFRLKFANLIQSAKANATPSINIKDGLIGSIDGLTYSPDIEQGFFDPREENTGGNNSMLYPQTIKLTFGFTVAHDHALGWDAQKKFRSVGAFPYPKKTEGDGG